VSISLPKVNTTDKQTHLQQPKHNQILMHGPDWLPTLSPCVNTKTAIATAVIIIPL
jgi:hypothetical protein